jgi:hypothetical protein
VPNPALSGKVIYIFDWERLDGSKTLIVGTLTHLYRFSPPSTFIVLNAVPFTTAEGDRWQSAIVNNKLYLVNGADPIQEYDGATLIPLAGDATMPTTARYISNIANHLVVAEVVETIGGAFRQRVRWSEIDNPAVWTPAFTNEANFIDIGELGDQIQNIAALGPLRLVVFKRTGIYLLTYVGLPFVFTVERVVTNEGLRHNYSVASNQDVIYFVGFRDIYAFNGSNLQPIGVNRIRDYLFGSMIPDNPRILYTHVHPLFPEIWFVFQGRDSTTYSSSFRRFNRAIIYNYELDAWTHRDYFPMSALGNYVLTTERTFDQITTPWNEAVGTWLDKRSLGSIILLGGDELGDMFCHGFCTGANDVVITGTLETGDKNLGTHTHPKRSNRLANGLRKLSIGDVFIEVGCRNNFDDAIAYMPAILLNGHPHIDYRVTANTLRFRWKTATEISLSDYSYFAQGAGDRIDG